MTMLFNNVSTDYYSSETLVRAYAVLEDGTVIYSDVEDYTVYRIADYLYQNLCVNTFAGHNYLYDKILSVVNPAYQKVDFYWGTTLVKF